jgi:integrase
MTVTALTCVRIRTKSKKQRRIDMSRQLRQILLAHREPRLLNAYLNGNTSIAEELVFPSPEGSVLDPDNLYKRYFLPIIEKAGLRKFRFHDMRHTFGSLLIQKGASLKYVSEQMGHSSIKVTADIYGQLIPGADVSWIDKLDSETTPQPNATQAQPTAKHDDAIDAGIPDFIGGGGRTRTYDLRIMRPSL